MMRKNTGRDWSVRNMAGNRKYVPVPPDSNVILMCSECGNAVINRAKHEEWHSYVEYWFGEFSGENARQRKEEDD